MPPSAPTIRDRPPTTARGVVLAALLLAVGGCRPAADVLPGDIRTYSIPKGAEPTLASAAPTTASPVGGPAEHPQSQALRYEAPEGWTDAGATGMRLATLLIGDPAERREVTVIPASGSLASNVERWQKQLDPEADAVAVSSKAAAAISAAETIDVDGTPATIVLLRGGPDDGQAILGAMLPVEDAAALFVKFRGDSEIALRERERFTRFVSSIRWKE